MSILILGMHRSGTSAVAALVHRMGAEYCHQEKDLTMNQDTHNPTGYFERTDIFSLNNELLEEAGGSWHDTIDLDFDRIAPPWKSTFEARSAAIIAGLQQRSPFFVKDPRLCLTLPYWLPIFEAPLAIVVYRHPLEVALSLRKRDALPISLGLALWEYYSRSLLSATRDLPVLAIPYENLLAQPLETAQTILRFATDHRCNGLSIDGDSTVTDAIDSTLHRNRAQGDELNLPPGVESLYQAFNDLSESGVVRSAIPSLSRYSIEELTAHRHSFELYAQHLTHQSHILKEQGRLLQDIDTVFEEIARRRPANRILAALRLLRTGRLKEAGKWQSRYRRTKAEDRPKKKD